MFDIGWGEFFLIGVVALIVVGPKELPGLFRTVGQWTGKARAMAREFQRSLEQAANETGMNEVSQSLKSLDRHQPAIRRSRQPCATSAAKAVSRRRTPRGAAAPPRRRADGRARAAAAADKSAAS